MDKLPEKLRGRLLPFQIEGVQFAIKKDGRCLIADEMGLGKTLQAISIACVYREEWPILIITPSSLKFSWIEELEKWLPDVLPGHINLVHSGADASGINSSPISIISYGLLRLPSSVVVRTAITARKFKIIICDESHYLKNTKSLSTKVIVPIIKAASRKILLSGTPALAKPVELFPQIDAICPGKFGSFWQFTERYCDAHVVFYGRTKRHRKVDGASNLEELQKKMHSSLMIRREKSDVLTELPPKQRQRILFELKDSTQKKEILQRFDHLRQNITKGNTFFQLLAADKESDEAQRSGNMEDGSNEGGILNSDGSEDTSVFREISSLYKLSGEAKIGPVRDYIEMLCENNTLKFLVFAYHHSMMDGIQQSLHDKNIKFVRIDGHTKGFERQACVNAFQSDNSIRVAILSILAAGVGLTLTAAKLVVFAELYWTPGVMVQCEDRAHRIGQVDSLPVHYLVAKNTMDEWVWSAVCRKTYVTSTALSGKSKRLEHEEGESYQVDLLSNADVWKAKEETGTINVSELIQTQRAPDQPSILNFLSPSRKTAGNSLPQTPCDIDGKKMKNSTTIQNLPQNSQPPKSCLLPNKRRAHFEEVIVLDSEDEEAFQLPSKKRKKNRGALQQKNKGNKSLKGQINGCDEPNEIIGSMTAGNRQQNCDQLSNKKVKGTDDNHNNQSNKILSESISCVSNSKEKNESFDTAILSTSQNEPIHSSSVVLQASPERTNTDKKKTMKKYSSPTNKQQDLSRTPRRNSFLPSSDHTKEKNKLSVSVLQNTEEENPGESPVLAVRPESRSHSKHWPCTLCTFMNHADLPFCEMCDSPKTKKIPSKTNLHNPAVLHASCRKSPCVVKSSHSETESDNDVNVHEDDLCEGSTMDMLETSRQNQSAILDEEEDKDQRKNKDSEDNSLVSDDISHNVSDVPGLSVDDNDQNHACVSNDIIELPDSVSNSPDIDMTVDIASPRPSHHEVGQSLVQNHSLNTSPYQPSTVISDSPATEGTVDSCDVCPNEETVDPSNICRNEGTANPSNICRNEGITEPIHKCLKFSCSVYTGRIFVHDEKEESLHANFFPIDIELGNISELPDFLRRPQHLRLIQRFVRSWSSLADTKKKLIAKRALVFADPYKASEDVKSLQGSTQRHMEKSDLKTAMKKARDRQGTVRQISRPFQSSHEETATVDTIAKGVNQVIDSDGIPLCLQCEKPYSNSLLAKQMISASENAWLMRLCSYACMDKYWTLNHASYCRDQIYAVERGICQLCQFSAHEFYNRMKVMKDIKRRAEVLRKSPYHKLANSLREKMVLNPVPGQFWHADHITPVWQGGGMCDMDNLRTLCTPCHNKVTSRQAGQRATARKLSSAVCSRGIAAFFQR